MKPGPAPMPVFRWVTAFPAPKTTPVTGDIDTDGFVGGVFAGYNFQNDIFVYGVEGDIGYNGVEGRARRHRDQVRLRRIAARPYRLSL